MDFHQLLVDVDAYNDFVEKVLPDNEFGEVFFICAMARKKYFTGDDEKTYAHRDGLLHKDIATNKNALFRKLLGVNKPLGAYTDRNNKPYKTEHLVIYISVNPRDQEKADKQTFMKMSKFYTGLEQKHHTVRRTAYSNVQNCAGKKHYFDIDVDKKDPQIVTNLLDKLLEIGFTTDDYHIIATRSGWHVLVKFPRKESGIPHKYLNILKQHAKQTFGEDVEIKTDTMLPVPGFLQGGFKVQRVTREALM